MISYATVLTSLALALWARLAEGKIVDLTTQPLDSSSYDYVIIGGGLAGNVLAGRLSEDPLVRVAVLEAGPSGIGNINITVPGYTDYIQQSDYNWNFKTVPQKFASNTTVPWLKGRALGGSTVLNGRIYTRGEKADYDAFERLGNPGWNWETLLAASKKSETFHPPSQELIDKYGYKFDASNYGTDGPVDFTISPWDPEFIVKGYFPSAELLGHKVIQDGNSGFHDGLHFNPSYVNEKGSRETAFDAYYDATRENLTMYTNAHVARILFNDTSSGNATALTASAVEFLYPNGTTGIVNVEKEVILAAGSVQTPQVLELSGIGDPEILKEFDIEVKYALPGVGANVQDHPAVFTTWSVEAPYYNETFSSLANDTIREQDFQIWNTTGGGLLASSVAGIHYASLSQVLNSSAEDLAEASRLLATKPNGISQAQFDLQKEGILNGTTVIEYVPIPNHHGADTPEPGVGYLLVLGAPQHALSRGTIHIQSTDPLVPPVIDPHYFEAEFDVWIAAKAMVHIREILHQAPFQAVLANETEPGPAAGVETFEDWLKWSRGHVASEYHAIGSASLLPEKDGGVVDPQARVYGTSNVRVADASLIPLHISAHTASITYAVAELVADKVKEG